MTRFQIERVMKDSADRGDRQNQSNVSAFGSGALQGTGDATGAGPRRTRRGLPLAILLVVFVALAIGAAVAVGRWPQSAAEAFEQVTEPNPDVVVLVHGLGRSRLSMMPLEWVLEAEGYRVFNWGYSSTCCNIEELADQLAEDLEGQAPGPTGRIHFVGHSLGNIIVRSMLAEEPPPALGRVVMLAPPNQGSRTASRFLPVLGWLYPPLEELTPAKVDTLERLPVPPTVEVGVIAGEHDGKVSVAESHMDGERDHAVVPSAHTFIMVRWDVARMITWFLERGTFPDA